MAVLLSCPICSRIYRFDADPKPPDVLDAYAWNIWSPGERNCPDYPHIRVPGILEAVQHLQWEIAKVFGVNPEHLA